MPELLFHIIPAEKEGHSIFNVWTADTHAHDLINMSALGLRDKCFIAEEYVIKALGAAAC